jgi:hypothetical protein
VWLLSFAVIDAGVRVRVNSFLLGRLLGRIGQWDISTPELLHSVSMNSSCWRVRLAASEALMVTGKAEHALVEVSVRPSSNMAQDH